MARKNTFTAMPRHYEPLGDVLMHFGHGDDLPGHSLPCGDCGV